MLNTIKRLLIFINTQKLYREIKSDFQKKYNSLQFDVGELDDKIEFLAEKVYLENKKKFKTPNKPINKYSILATQIYETGGHTNCIINLAKSLYKEKNNKIPIYFSKIKSSLNKAETKFITLKKYSKITGIHNKTYLSIKKIIQLYNAIIEDYPEIIYVFTNPNDIISSIVLSIVKNTTNIKIIFFNHASHFPTLGMKLADLILEGMPSCEKITNKQRKIQNTKIIGLQSSAKEDVVHYSADELQKLKHKLNINKTNQITMSGGAAYKFFENSTSKHFELVENLLNENPNLFHIAIIKFNKKQEKTINKIFKDKNTKNRFIVINPTTEYEKYFQLADVFIDSFPISSALTQIDLMKLKVATVVKINKKVPQWSFHEYLPKNYPYMFEDIKDMKNGITELLNNKQKKEKIIESNYNYWLKTYEENKVKEHFVQCAKEINNDIKLVNFKYLDYDIQLETLNWRNSNEVSQYFKISKIDKQTHIKWLKSLEQKKATNIAFMIFYQNQPIGVTYFHSINYNKKIGDWGIYIYKTDLRGKGIGDFALKKCIDIAKQIKLKILYLDVLNTNKKAIKLYTSNGFTKTDKQDIKFIRYSKTL